MNPNLPKSVLVIPFYLNWRCFLTKMPVSSTCDNLNDCGAGKRPASPGEDHISVVSQMDLMLSSSQRKNTNHFQHMPKSSP